jgi:phosphoribosylaminoimidazolecarboxamide formyltransferase/IMP cyclohydrolase
VKQNKRALISVYDKTGILDLASFLSGAGWEIISTGGTAKYLGENNIAVIDVSSVTNFPECLDGRVKTLHPAIHAGLLARRDLLSHLETLKTLNLETIDLTAVNLYPFFEKVQSNLPLEETIEFIDIGGPSMLRSAAKNFRDVLVLSDSDDYPAVIKALQNPDGVLLSFRKYLAAKVFDLTASYDAAVARYLLAGSCGENPDPEQSAGFPLYWPLSLKKAQNLRYGENNHQSAALYLNTDRPGAIGGMRQLHGKELGFNNIRDLDLAWKAVCSFGAPAYTDSLKDLSYEETQKVCCVAVKHNTPCGIALGPDLPSAFLKAYDCDPVSIFGGIVAVNTTVDPASAEKLGELFLEIVVAPDFTPEALSILQKKKNLRIIKAPRSPGEKYECISVDGGLLVQETDHTLFEKWEVVTKTPVETNDIGDMVFGIRAVSWVKSNAIVVVKNRAALGIGGGQTNRIWAAEQALSRAKAVEARKENTAGADARVMASDAFFPFSDVVEAASSFGIRAIIQPGGSIRDTDSIAACDKHGIAMVFTGTRHFKH